jgi:copper homeostasis protein
MMQLEICVDSVESAIAAQQGGAHRIELCSALNEAGLTPSIGLIRAVRKHIDIGLYVMIRPRGGDFLHSADELAVMREDIAQAAKSGADGVVFGLLTEDGDIDVAKTRELIDVARPMEVTFHRAIDMARDLDRAVCDVIETGADRLLTSGGAQTALLGAAAIERMVRASAGKIQIMVCGGVRAENVSGIVRSTGAVQFHAAVRREVGSRVKHRPRSLHLGASPSADYARKVVMAEDVRKLRAAMDALRI